ncbi:MAG: TolC family protein [Candidatus Sericytochromatia bacterium]|nr:TolC family protein [Candidatus Sericytochromatia bacterium]
MSLLIAAAQGGLPALAQPPLQPAALLGGLEASYPPLASARAELQAAEALRTAAEGGFDPAWRTRAAVLPTAQYPHQRLDTSLEQPTPFWGATLFGGWRRGLGAFASYDGKLATNDGGEVRGGISLPLWRNGAIDRRRADLARADAAVTAAEAQLRTQRLEAARQAAARYWDWVAAGQRVAVARRWLGLAQRRDADLGAAVRAGALPALERQENERAVQQRVGHLALVERGLEQAAIELSLFWRDAAGAPRLPEPGLLPGRLPPMAPLAEALLHADLASAPDVRPEPRRLEAALLQARIELALAENQLAPAVDVSVLGSQDLGAGDPGRATPELEAGLSLEVPLLARTPRGRIAQAGAAVAGLEAQLRFARDRVQAEVRDAASAVGATARRAEAAGRERAIAERLALAEAERLRLGEGSLFLVNLREQAAAEAAVREADALGEHQRARAQYEAAVGRLALPEGQPTREEQR